ncbi:MAG: hypothetical protein P1P90_05495 [Patescibacteria group bacterium]|nr:hypothetical protein [Patescibacteria group bacterium]
MLHPHLYQWAQAIQLLNTIETIMSKHDIESAVNTYFSNPDFDPRNPLGSTNQTGYAHYPINLPEMYLSWKAYQDSTDITPSSPSIEVELVFTDNHEKTDSRKFAIRCDMDTQLWEMSYLDIVPDQKPDIESPLGDDYVGSFNLKVGNRKNIPKMQAVAIIEDMAEFFKQRCLKQLHERMRTAT